VSPTGPRWPTVELDLAERAWKCPNGSDTGVVSGHWDDTDDGDVSPICPACGVSALPPEAPGEPSMCENPDCSAFGELMDR